MGLMSREKGKRWERTLCRRFREHWPSAVLRRASQAERPDQPDLFFENAPEVLLNLWIEANDEREPRPLVKLQQAERDIIEWLKRRPLALVNRMPVVIWHRLGERHSSATTRLWVVDLLRGIASTNMEAVTMGLETFEGLLISAARDGAGEERAA